MIVLSAGIYCYRGDGKDSIERIAMVNDRIASGGTEVNGKVAREPILSRGIYP